MTFSELVSAVREKLDSYGLTDCWAHTEVEYWSRPVKPHKDELRFRVFASRYDRDANFHTGYCDSPQALLAALDRAIREHLNLCDTSALAEVGEVEALEPTEAT